MVGGSRRPSGVVVGDYCAGTGANGRNYDVSPDGQRFLMLNTATEGASAPPQIIVVRNWLEEPKRLVPAP